MSHVLDFKGCLASQKYESLEQIKNRNLFQSKLQMISETRVLYFVCLLKILVRRKKYFWHLEMMTLNMLKIGQRMFRF